MKIRVSINRAVWVVFSLGALAGSFGYYMWVRKFTHSKPRIAVLTKDSPFFNQVCNGIEASAADYFKNGCEIRYFYGKGTDKVIYQTMVEEAFMSKPDLIVPVGVSFAQLCVAAACKRCTAIPVVFAGPGEPVEQGLVSSLGARQEAITGISLTPVDYFEPARLLLAAKPTVKNILIPYFHAASAGILEGVSIKLKDFFSQQGVFAIPLPLRDINEAKELIAPFMSRVDTIMCLTGDTIAEANDVLVKLCNQHSVTLFAKDIECVRDGAALGYGVEASLIGRKVMQLADSVLNKKIYPGSIPIQFVDGDRMLVLNREAAALQRITITPELLALAREVF